VFRLITSREREKRQLSENVQQVERYIRKRIDELKSVKDLAYGYLELKRTSKNTIDSQLKMKDILTKINSNYPNLIKHTNDYEGAVDDMNKVIKTASTELKNMYKSLKDTEELKLTIKLGEITKEINKLSDDLKSNSFVDRLRSVLNFNFDKETIPNLKKFRKIFKETFYELDEASTFNPFTQQTKLDIFEFANAIKNTVTDSEGIKRVQNDVLNITEKLKDITIEKGKIEAKGRTFFNNDYAALNNEYNVLNDILAVYTSALANANKLNSKLNERKTIEQEIADINLAKPISQKPDKKPTENIDRNKDDEINAAADLEKRKSQLLFDIKQQLSNSELELARTTADKNLATRIAFFRLEYKNKLNELERERQLALQEAEETGADANVINKKYDDIELVNKKLLLQKIKKLRDDDSAKSEQFLQEKFDREDKLLNDHLRFRAELEFANEPGYEGSIEKYAEFLNNKLILEKDFNENYLKLKQNLYDLESALKQRQFNEIQKYSNFILAGISGGIDQLWNQWVMSSRKAKSDMDAIWIAIKNSALRAIQDIVTAEITKALLKLITNIISIGFGGFNPLQALAAPISPAIPGSAVGSEVKGSGMLNVHPGEIVVPATIVRKNRKKYDEAIDGGSSNNGNNVRNDIVIPVTVNNPAIDDRRYWGDVVEKYIVPELEKLGVRR